MASGRQGNGQVEAVVRACDLIESFRSEGELLRLRDLVARTGLHKATAFRILGTLERRGWIERVGRFQYRAVFRPSRGGSFRLGYATQSEEFAFSRAVTESIIRAAEAERLPLIVLNNRYSAKVAVRNAEILVKEKVDLAIEFQTDEHVAPVISSKFLEAEIPLIAVEIPHPGATYYGANNYRAGEIGGRQLGRWAKVHWQGQVDEVILLELRMAGALPRARLTGTLAGIRYVLPHVDDRAVVYLNGNGQFGASLEIVRKHLRRSRAKRTLIAAINDPSVIGALRAFEEAGRAEQCAGMGQNASAEARAELRRPDARLIGSVGYFPEQYGDALVPLAIDILTHRAVPPAVFVKHQLITPENVDHFYPNDQLLSPADVDAVLLHPAL